MKFKDALSEEQFYETPDKLSQICLFFESLSLKFGIEPVITRVKEPVQGDSGVHESGRAVDFRDEHTVVSGGKSTVCYLYTQDQVIFIVNAINETYPRKDGRMVCIHHSFHGSPQHFHVQIGADWV